MADYVRRQLEGVPNEMRSRYRDMGDGTHALVTATEAEIAGIVQTTSATLDQMQADYTERVTSAVRTITSDHGAIHEKEGYSAYVTFANVADAATRNIVMTTAATMYVHLKFYDIWIDNASGTFQVYENPQSVADGTPVAAVNRNRLAPVPTSAETLVHTATVNLTGATLLETLRFGGGGTGPQGRAGGDRSTDIEWVLAQGESYVFLITNTSGAVANIGVWLFWYEEAAG
jgi:hypothetical protein